MSESRPDPPRNELFVRSIPRDINEEQLTAFFSDFAPVKHSVIVRDRENGESKGFGFVSFGTAEDAAAARDEGAKKPIAGHALQIDIAKPRNRRDERPSRVTADENIEYKQEKRKPRIIVRNCPWSLRDPQELVKIFSRFGKVVEAYIPRGKKGLMSGFAFVTMKRKRHAKRAIEELKNLKIHDREVNVGLALEKSKWENRVDPDAPVTIDSDSEDESESDDQLYGENEDDNNTGLWMEGEDEPPKEDDIGSEGSENLSDNAEDQQEISEEEDEDEPPKASSKKPPVSNEHTIFVRNVPYDADSESLKEHFSQFGRVLYALPVMDKVKNYPKGTAFVAFKYLDDCEACVAAAPEVTSSSLLVPDDVDARYVYEGRVLNVSRAVKRDTADRLTEKRSNERLEALGRGPKINDKRRLFLLNEGRISSQSKLAEIIPKSEMEIRDKSYKLRKQQLSKNPSLHLSMTRLAIRNLPRAMDEKALKALGRKAVVQFATEVKEGKRQPLTKEEIMRSVHHEDSTGGFSSKKHGVVRQAKIIQEVKGSGQAGRSRGYGFLELRNHKAALMALRWLNAHLVTPEEIAADNTTGMETDKKRRLVVEFAIENAQIVKRQREKQHRAQERSSKRKAEDMEAEAESRAAAAAAEEAEASQKRGNSAIGRKRKNKKLKRGN